MTDYLKLAEGFMVRRGRYSYASLRTLFDVDPETGCWVWNAGRFQNGGYARIKVNGRGGVAHRYVYEQLVGPIEEGLQLDHLCRVRNCVNPLHLEPVTARENQLRGNTFTRENSFRTHCIHGHAFTDENTIWENEGIRRRCRTCNVARTKVYYKTEQGREKHRLAEAKRRLKLKLNPQKEQQNA